MLNLIAADGLNWDNTKRWDSETEILTVENIFGLGEDVASFELITEQEVGVFPNPNPQVVHKFNINFTETENNVFNDVEFYYINKDMKEFDRPYRWMIEIEDVEAGEYEYIIEQEEVCNTDKNGTYFCNMVTSKSEMRKRYKWIPIEDNTILKGNHTIGFEVVVKSGDYVEFVPTILGVRMPEFAAWSDALNDSLYYATNLSGVGTVNNDFTGAGFGAFPLLNSSGLLQGVAVTQLPNGIDTTNGYLDRAGQSIFNGTIGTIAFWIQPMYSGDSTPASQQELFAGDADYFRYFKQTSGDNYIKVNDVNSFDIQGAGWWNANEWVLMIIKFDCGGTPDTHELWANNVKVANSTTACAGQPVQEGFQWGRGTTSNFKGNTTSIYYWYKNLSTSEMTSLYAGGAGMEYTPPPASTSVSIKYPANSSYNSVITQLNYTTNGDDSCWYSNDSGTTNSSIISAGTNWTGLNYGTGNYGVIIYCNDSRDFDGNDTVHFTVDLTAPYINWTAPTNTTYSDASTTENSTQVVLNWTWDSDMETCWWNIDNNGTNFTIDCTSNGTIQNTTYGNHNITFWTNDTANNINSTSVSATWIYIIFEHSHRFNDTTYEMLDEDFEIDLSYAESFTSSSANLIYNGTSYLGTKIGSGARVNFTKIDFPVPAINETNPLNLTFYWDILLTNVTGSFHFNSTKYEQRITKIELAVCNATYETIYVNFSIHNEETRLLQQADISASFFYTLGTGTVTKNYSMSVINNTFTLCPNVNNTFIMSSIINLQNASYNERTYEFIDRTYTNTTTTTELFMLPLANGTVIIMQVKDSGLVPLEGYVIEIWRYYPINNTYELVESSPTDEYGQTVSTRLVENTVDYVFKIKNTVGTIVKQTGRMRINCAATPCFQRFIIEDTTDYFEIIGDVDDFTSTLTWTNTTNTFTYIWNDVTGDIATQRLLVTRYNFNGTTIACNETSISASGSFTCDVGTSRSDYIASAYRRVSGKGEILIFTLTSSVLASGWGFFGWSGLFWSFFFLMTCVSIGYWKPPIGFGLYGVGILLLNVMDIISLNPAVLMAHFAIIIIAIWAWKG